MAISANLPLSVADRAMWESRKTEAQTAYHELMTGQSVASFTDQNGERVTYSKTDAKLLALYIADIIALLGTPVTAATSLAPRPMRFLFGRS
jgi:hypothetical protein